MENEVWLGLRQEHEDVSLLDGGLGVARSKGRFYLRCNCRPRELCSVPVSTPGLTCLQWHVNYSLGWPGGPNTASSARHPAIICQGVSFQPPPSSACPGCSLLREKSSKLPVSPALRVGLSRLGGRACFGSCSLN